MHMKIWWASPCKLETPKRYFKNSENPDEMQQNA